MVTMDPTLVYDPLLNIENIVRIILHNMKIEDEAS